MFKEKQFDIEHALSMYALSDFCFPVEAIYDDEIIKSLGERVNNCHIYMIGLMPETMILDVVQKDSELIVSFNVLDKEHDISIPIQDGYNLVQNENDFFVENDQGEQLYLPQNLIMNALSNQIGGLPFNVQYIGQAYGADGSRNAIDRLRKHETLQKISIKGTPDGHRLMLYLLEIEPANQVFTFFNPFADDTTQGEERIQAGVKKLFGTSEGERITLYEASLIRYFRPHFNTVFKNSFPSTKMKVLEDCYEKDFSAIVAEICFDHNPFLLCSENVEPSEYHIIRHNLHETAERQVFFFGK